MYTRRKFAKFGLGALGALPFSHSLSLVAMKAKATPKINPMVSGVRLGLASYSLATLPHEGVVDVLIRTMVEAGIGECNLYDPLILPSDIAERVRITRPAAGAPPAPMTPERLAADNELKQWRATVSLDYFRDIRKKFDAAGLGLPSYSPPLATKATTDEELIRSCDISKALGVSLITTAMAKSVAKRFAPFAEKYDLKVGLEGRPKATSTDPDAVATPESFLEAVTYSKNYSIQLDTGDATAGGFDVPAFIKANHEKMCGLNLKDRTKDGKARPYGEGDTPVKAILQMVRDNKWPLFVYVDCDYVTAPDSTRVADVKRCYAYMKTALAT